MNVIKKNDELLRFNCPGCRREHAIQHGSDFGPNWGWNGSLSKPTFTPSVLVTYEGKDAGLAGAPPAVCHTFVTDGRIQFLGDCTHVMAGQTVDLPVWEEKP
uniref:DUF6527 family protein n=1 Tax=Comamonas testosteroni TaxID=285 RepID=UPI0015FCCF4C|nr:DUF6527 family protein [Comamonas testosteroni]